MVDFLCLEVIIRWIIKDESQVSWQWLDRSWSSLMFSVVLCCLCCLKLLHGPCVLQQGLFSGNSQRQNFTLSYLPYLKKKDCLTKASILKKKKKCFIYKMPTLRKKLSVSWVPFQKVYKLCTVHRYIGTYMYTLGTIMYFKLQVCILYR